MTATRLTITEALAEIKTIGKRIETNWSFILPRLARPAQLIDPLANEGGTAAAIAQKRQSSKDLRARVVKLRAAIALANQQTIVTIEGETRSIADWIVWRREISKDAKKELDDLAKALDSLRNNMKREGRAIKGPEPTSGSTSETDVYLHISETELARDRDRMEKILGDLDGQLSLKNATTFVEITD